MTSTVETQCPEGTLAPPLMQSLAIERLLRGHSTIPLPASPDKALIHRPVVAGTTIVHSVHQAAPVRTRDSRAAAQDAIGLAAAVTLEVACQSFGLVRRQIAPAIHRPVRFLLASALIDPTLGRAANDARDGIVNLPILTVRGTAAEDRLHARRLMQGQHAYEAGVRTAALGSTPSSNLPRGVSASLGRASSRLGTLVACDTPGVTSGAIVRAHG